MVILHIASVRDNPFSGVCVSVPLHIISQSKCAEVGFINITNISIHHFAKVTPEDLAFPKYSQIRFNTPFDINDLPKPFCAPDIVVFHGIYAKEYLSMSAGLRKNNIPYIIVPHGMMRVEAQRKKKFKKRIANSLLFNRFFKNSLAIQCLSKAEMDSTHFGTPKFLGTNGISVPSQKKDSFSKRGIKFIYIGRYEWKIKGLDLLFGAIQLKAKILREEGAHFELFGPDHLGQLVGVKKLAKKNRIEDLVTINTEISGEEKERKILESDIFTQTSRNEGMPMGILEALSYGLPCLVTEGTSLASMINKHNAGWGVLTTKENIAQALQDIIENRDSWNFKGQNARKLIEDEFLWSKISENTVKNYQEILDEQFVP